MVLVRDEQLVIQIPAFEIFVPGRGLLIEQYSAFAEAPISFERSPRIFISWFGQEAGIRTRTVRFTGGDAAVTPQSWKI